MNVSRTWALVMNGVRARILRSLADGDGELPVEIVSRAALRHLRDTLARKAGWVDSQVTDGKTGGDDPVVLDMQEFAAETGEVLEQHRRAGDFAWLALFAEPRMLAILHTELPATLRKVVVLELPLNLITLPERELRWRIRTLLRNES